MATIGFIGKRSLIPGHIAGVAYTLEIELTEARRSASVKKTQVRSLGGAMEVLRDYSDTEWQITFEPVSGERLELLRELLGSTDAGEPFTIDMYGNSSSVKTFRRTDEGYSEEPFMRRGTVSTDLFQISITAIEA